ncbi:bifunctional metallophosphatase/5'-nucleotidase [Desulfothermus sp.]
MKRLILILSFLYITILSGCANSTDGSPRKVVLLTTADLQSQILPFKTKIDGEKKIVGGFEKIRNIYDEYTSKYANVILISTGDDLFGPFYKIFEGKPEIEGMNLSGYSVVTCGNHEFDNGVDFYLKAIKDAKFNIVCSNLSISNNTCTNVIEPYFIKELEGGVKVGFFGLVTPDLKKVSNVQDKIEVKKHIIPVARQMVKKLKEKGVSIIIALTHIGKELDLELAQNVSHIDFIIGGHDHIFFHEIVKDPSGEDTVVVQAGSKGIKIGVLEFTIKDNKVVSSVWKTILLDENVPGDISVHQAMQYYMDKYEEKMSGVIGESNVDLDARKSIIRTQESNLGNFIADSWTSWIDNNAIALVNAGSIRGDRIYPTGKITYKTAMDMLPFMNEIYEVELTGKQLKQVLEISASSIVVPGDGCDPQDRPSSGGFFQVSNIKFDIDLKESPFCAIYNEDRTIYSIINKGERIKDVMIFKNGKPESLALEKKYKVLVNGWTVSGGDGYYIFLDPNILKNNTTNIGVDLFIEHVKKLSPIFPEVEGRIKIIR